MTDGKDCKWTIPDGEQDKIGKALADVVTFHEVMEHGLTIKNADEVQCKPARIELAAYIVHCLGISLAEIDQVKAKIQEHLPACKCEEVSRF